MPGGEAVPWHAVKLVDDEVLSHEDGGRFGGDEPFPEEDCPALRGRPELFVRAEARIVKLQGSGIRGEGRDDPAMVAKGRASLVPVTEGEWVEAADLGPQGVVVDPAEAACEKEDTSHIPAVPFFLVPFEILPECVIALPVCVLGDPQNFALGESGQVVLAAPSAACADERHNDVKITEFDFREKKAPVFHGPVPFAVEPLTRSPLAPSSGCATALRSRFRGIIDSTRTMHCRSGEEEKRRCAARDRQVEDWCEAWVLSDLYLC